MTVLRVLAALVIGLVAAAAAADGRDDFRNAQAAADSGDFALAAALYSRAVQSGDLGERARAMAYYNRANAQLAAGRSDLALEDYGIAIALAADFSDAYVNRAIVQRRAGRLAAALADLDRALELEPKNGRALTNRGNVRVDLFEFDAAVADYRAALQIDANDRAARANMSNAREAALRYREALSRYDQAIEKNPGGYFGYLERGVVRMNLGDYKRAVEDLEAANKINPSDAYTVLWLYAARNHAGLDAAAALAAERGRIGESQWPGQIVGMLTGEREVTEVEPLAHQGTAEEQAQRQCVFHYFRGQLLLAQGDRAQAAASFRSAIQSGVKDYLQYLAAEAELARLKL